MRRPDKVPKQFPVFGCRSEWKLCGDGRELVFSGSRSSRIKHGKRQNHFRGLRTRAAAVWSAVEIACRREDFRPKPGPLCGWCAYKAYCPAFGGACTPRTPLGATMVSGEGACAAYFQYRRRGIDGVPARELRVAP